MNITQEKTSELTATIKIDLEPADYQEKIEKQLKYYQRNANMPGFRPGKVPLGLIKKIYGKAIMYDVVNNLFNDALYQYLEENNIEILASPLPNPEKNQVIDFDTQTNFSFYFDIAIAPEFTVDLNESIKVKKYKIAVSEETIDKYLNELRKRHGTIEQREYIEDNDMIYGEFTELDENEQPKENGIKNHSFVYLENITNEEYKKKFIGLKKEDYITVDIKKIARNDFDAAYFIGVKKEQLSDITSLFRFTVKEIHHNKPAELNEEFYKKVYPTDNITTIEEMRERIRKDVEEHYEKESENKLYSDIIDVILSNTKFDLPEDFLKRYLYETSKNENVTKEQIEQDFEKQKKSIQWQLIENKLVKEHNLYVTPDETREFVKSYFRKAHEHNHEHNHDHEHEHHDEEHEKRLDLIADKILENHEETRKINDRLFDNKFFDFLKSKISIETTTVTYEEFIKLLTPIKN